MLQLLIVRGVELNTITTKRRLTALQKAVEKQYTKCVRLLVDNHCDVNLPVSSLDCQREFIILSNLVS